MVVAVVGVDEGLERLRVGVDIYKNQEQTS